MHHAVFIKIIIIVNIYRVGYQINRKRQNKDAFCRTVVFALAEISCNELAITEKNVSTSLSEHMFNIGLKV